MSNLQLLSSVVRSYVPGCKISTDGSAYWIEDRAGKAISGLKTTPQRAWQSAHTRIIKRITP